MLDADGAGSPSCAEAARRAGARSLTFGAGEGADARLLGVEADGRRAVVPGCAAQTTDAFAR